MHIMLNACALDNSLMSKLYSIGGLILIACFTAAPPARADVLRSVKDCVPGKRVQTSDGHKGKITRIDQAWSYCYVLQDDTGKEVSYLYSLLQTEGTVAGKGNQLVPGVYECVADGHYTFMDMRITGANTYASAGANGKFHIEPSGKMVFESGPLSKYFAKVLSGGRIGLNANGDSFYATSCELNRNKH